MVNRVCRHHLSIRGDNVRPPGDTWPGDNLFRVRDQQHWPSFDCYREMIMGAWTTFSSFSVAFAGFPYPLAPRPNGESDGN